MRAHYFDRPFPDWDDELLLDAIRKDLVPPGCLLGGVVLDKVLRAGLKPCKGCNGPRGRCGGLPKATPGVGADPRELKRLHGLFTSAGAGSDPLAILRKKT